MPAALTERIQRAFAAALRSPEVAARLADLGFEIVASTPAEFAAFQAAEIGRWTAVVQKGGKFGLMDIKGNLYQKTIWDAIKYAGAGKWLLISEGQTSIANERGEVFSADKVDEALGWGDKCIAARKGKVWGFIGSDGKWLYEPKFEEVKNYRGRSALVKINGKWGAVDRNGTVLEPFIHNRVKTLPNGVDLLD
jgi:hypothetical protein